MLSQLKQLATAQQKSLNEKLIPNSYPILGVKIPDLKKLARQIAKSDFTKFLNNNEKYFEQVLLCGLVIGYAKCDIKTRLDYLKVFVPKISDWAICDCSVSNFKFVKENMEVMWDFILPYYNSNKEFYVRFAVTVMLSYFINENYIDRVLSEVAKFNNDGYYAKMGVAWLLSVCFVKFRDKTLNFLLNCKLDVFTFNKTISKCCESFRVLDSDKTMLKSLKRV